MVNCQWQKPPLCPQLQTSTTLTRKLFIHPWACTSQQSVFSACFLLNPAVLLSANAYCLIIAMCVSNCLVCSCDAPGNFNQALNNGALECVQPSMSAYHICPFTTRVCAEYKSAALHYLESERQTRGERQRERERIQSNSLVNCDPVWSVRQWAMLYSRILKEGKLLTCYYDTIFLLWGPVVCMIHQVRIRNTEHEIKPCLAQCNHIFLSTLLGNVFNEHTVSPK